MKMTWEETILKIRADNTFNDLVNQAYFHENLELNVKRFSESDEFKETLKLIREHASKATKVLDIGSGNGISAISFALKKYNVTAIEPNSSNIIGAGAIRKLKKHYKLDNIEIFESFAEDVSFKSNTFDIVYIRQAMHHANNLEKFIGESVRVLKPNGLLLTIRDHVVFNDADKAWFLNTHPLHKFYGGENAFSSREYREAIQKAGATVVKELKYYDSVINYFPITEEKISKMKQDNDLYQKERLRKKIGFLVSIPIVWKLYLLISNYKSLNEMNVPGRMYSYIAKK